MARRSYLRRSRQPTQAAAAGASPEITLATPHLRDLLADVKAFSPALARELRRNLRSSGEDIITEQRAVLDGPLPGNAAKTGTRLRLVAPSSGRRSYVRRVDTYGAVATGRSRSRGMRERIKRSLKTRVVAGTSRQGVNVRAEVRVGGVMAIQWQARVFRHPVFAQPDSWTYQQGQPYFWGPAAKGQVAAQAKIAAAIDQALTEIK